MPLPPPVADVEVVPAEVTGAGNPSGELNLPPSPAISAANRSTRANASSQGQTWINSYQSRIDPAQPERWWMPDDAANTAPSTTPWWDAVVRQPISTTSEPLPVDIATLTAGALRHSSFVRVVSANPSIRQTELVTQKAAFDWQAFLETTYDDVNDPVGNTLTTGTDADRYTEPELVS